ncbi:hypothetical protein BDF22DRAFT_664744 [Syncephalis plumigaleata]|nr:hypothetical protein BDF22DRAFT_664744 [Syncephalis plumigaleata]
MLFASSSISKALVYGFALVSIINSTPCSGTTTPDTSKKIPTFKKLNGKVIEDGHGGLYGKIDNPFLWRGKEEVTMLCDKPGGKFTPFKVIEHIASIRDDRPLAKMKVHFPRIDKSFYYDGRLCHILRDTCVVGVKDISTLSFKLNYYGKHGLVNQVIQMYEYMQNQGFYLQESFTSLCYTKEGNMAFRYIPKATPTDLSEYGKFGLLEAEVMINRDNEVFMEGLKKLYMDIFSVANKEEVQKFLDRCKKLKIRDIRQSDITNTSLDFDLSAFDRL